MKREWWFEELPVVLHLIVVEQMSQGARKVSNKTKTQTVCSSGLTLCFPLTEPRLPGLKLEKQWPSVRDGKQYKRFKNNNSLQMENGLSQLWAKQGWGLHWKICKKVLLLILVNRPRIFMLSCHFIPLNNIPFLLNPWIHCFWAGKLIIQAHYVPKWNHFLFL